MKMPFAKLVALTTLFASLALPASAYIGPGAGAGAFAVVIGVIASIFLGIFAIVWYPIKRMLRKGKANAKTTEVADDTAQS